MPPTCDAAMAFSRPLSSNAAGSTPPPPPPLPTSLGPSPMAPSLTPEAALASSCGLPGLPPPPSLAHRDACANLLGPKNVPAFPSV